MVKVHRLLVTILLSLARQIPVAEENKGLEFAAAFQI
jgi:hypothetical protein